MIIFRRCVCSFVVNVDIVRVQCCFSGWLYEHDTAWKRVVETF